MDEQTQRPTIWIVIAGVCAIAAIGLGIWGLSTKSDLDDANERVSQTLAQERSELSDEERKAAGVEAKEKAFGERALRRYRAVRRRFVAEEKRAAELKSDIAQENAQLAQARTAVANAQGQGAQLRAQLKHTRAQGSLARACARGALTAMDSFFDAADVESGANKALKELEDLQDECQAAVGEAT